MEMYYNNGRENNDDCSLDFNLDNGIINLRDTENHNENHQRAEEPDFYERNCDFDFFDWKINI